MPGEEAVGPAEPLVRGAAELADTFLAAPDHQPSSDFSCTDDSRLPYRLILEYPDGSHALVDADLGGCRLASDGSSIKVAASDLLDKAQMLWTEQRQERKGESTDLPGCSVESLVPADTENLTAAAWCRVDRNGKWQKGDSLPEDLVRDLLLHLELDDVGERVGELGDRREVLVLSDSFGSVVSFQRATDGKLVHSAYLDAGEPDGDGFVLSLPSDLAAELDRYHVR